MNIKKEYTIGFSPCPNDTFIFDALVNEKIDTQGIRFNAFMEDIETLNQWGLEKKLDVTKLSFGVIPDVLDHYQILNAGSALGKGCGPLLISKKEIKPDEVVDCRIAIPGEHTTANMLLTYAFPKAQNRFSVLFSKIESAVIHDEFDLGLIIHESRFTYAQKGLKRVMDLGEYWEQKTGYPIPLAGIVVSRGIPHEEQQKIDRLIKKSLEYAFDRYPVLSPFTTDHAQEMETTVMIDHIKLYVNNFSLHLGDEGKAAIEKMMNILSIKKKYAGQDYFV